MQHCYCYSIRNVLKVYNLSILVDAIVTRKQIYSQLQLRFDIATSTQDLGLFKCNSNVISWKIH